MRLTALTGINACLLPPIASTKPIDPQQNGTALNGTDEIVDLDESITFNNFSDVSSFPNSASGGGSDVTGGPLPDITPAVVRELAAISQLLKMTGLPIEQLLTLWTNLPSQESTSLFRRLFFTRRAGSADPAFAPDVNGDYFTGKATKISDHRSTVMAAFNLQAAELDFLLGLNQSDTSSVLVPDVLNMDNLSAVYRAKLLVRVLGIGIADIPQFAAAFADQAPNLSKCLSALISQPTTVLSILQKWAKVNDAAFPWTELRYVLDSVPTSLDPLAPTEIDALRLSKTLRDGILDIQTANPHVMDPANATDDFIHSKTTLVFNPDIVSGILDLIHGTTVYTTSAPVIEDENFPKQVAELIPGAKYILGSQPKLQITGILNEKQERSLQDLILPFCSPRSLSNGSVTGSKTIRTDGGDLKTGWIDSVAR